MAHLIQPATIAALLVVTPLAGQAPVPDPDLTGQLKQLHSMVKDRLMAQDLVAISVIHRLSAHPANLHPKDEARIAKAFARVYRTGRLRPPDRAHLYRETADALARLGDSGSAWLLKSIETERIKGRDHAQLRAHMIRALGTTGDERHVDWLTKQALRSPDDAVLAAAGAALGNYTGLPLKKRRKDVKDLVGRLGEWHMSATALESTDPNAPIDLGPQNARRTLSRIKRPWNATLRRLTGQRFSSAAQWQRWLNKNKGWKPPG